MLSSDGRRSGPVGRDERGFTLIELLVAVVIIGIIAVPLANVVIGYLRNADATTGRLSESHNAQISAAYFSADVASLGVRSTTYSSDPSAPYPLTQSIEENAAATGGLFPCGSAATPAAVLRFGWDDYPNAAAGAPTRMRVAYVLESAASGELQLHRLVCAGSATVSTDIVIAHDVVSGSVSSSCTPSPCSGSGASTPLVVNLSLAVHDPNSGASTPDYQIALTGQRRQS